MSSWICVLKMGHNIVRGFIALLPHIGTKFNSSAIAQWCNVSPTIGNTLLVAGV